MENRVKEGLWGETTDIKGLYKAKWKSTITEAF